MPRILFLVHGMGRHAADWANPLIPELDRYASSYAAFAQTRFSQQVLIRPITYDSIFQQILGAMSMTADGLAQYAASEGVVMPDIINWLQQANDEEKKFFWTHCVDVLLYRFFPNVSSPVRLQVLSQLFGILSGLPPGERKDASVLSYSLGTSVAHDALASIAGYPFNGKTSFMAGNFRFRNLFMIANVGRVLEPRPGAVYNTNIRPISAPPPPQHLPQAPYCFRYYNINHHYDPFVAPRRFDAQGWGARYHTIHLGHFHEFNIHDLKHYLDHPIVHTTIINATLNQQAITTQEINDAIRNYPVVKPFPCAAEVQAMLKATRDFYELIKDHHDVGKLIVAGSKYLALAKETSDACRAVSQNPQQ